MKTNLVDNPIPKEGDTIEYIMGTERVTATVIDILKMAIFVPTGTGSALVTNTQSSTCNY